MQIADVLLFSVLGFAQGYLVLPAFAWAPRVVWVSFPAKGRARPGPITRALFYVTFLLLYGLVQISLCIVLFSLSPSPKASGQVWGVAFILGIVANVLGGRGERGRRHE